MSSNLPPETIDFERPVTAIQFLEKDLAWYAKTSGFNSHKLMGLDLLKDFVSEMLNASM